MDYDMVMAFKSIPAFEAAQPTTQQNKLLMENIAAIKKFRRHNSNSRFWH
jgi:hypothetical protein